MARQQGCAGQGLPLVAVLAMTDDFEEAVLTGKNDRDDMPAKLRAKQSPEWDETATLAEAGMRHIEHDMLLLDAAGRRRARPGVRGAQEPARRTRSAGHRPTSPAWSDSALPGCGSTSGPGSTSGISCGLTRHFQPQSLAVDVASNYREDASLEVEASQSEDVF